MKTIWYRSEGDCHPLEVDSTTCLQRPLEARHVVEKCAEDFHSNHDRCECSWPRRFTLHETEDGPAVAIFEVEREAVPLFTAREAERQVNQVTPMKNEQPATEVPSDTPVERPVGPLCSQCGNPLSEYTAGLRYFGTHTAHVEWYCVQRMRARIEQLHAALHELVLLKDKKDHLDRLRDAAAPGTADEALALEEEYRCRKPLAWVAARAALKAER